MKNQSIHLRYKRRLIPLQKRKYIFRRENILKYLLETFTKLLETFCWIGRCVKYMSNIFRTFKRN